MTQPLVIDASIALKWFVEEPDSTLADDLLARTAVLHAPSLLKSELANALWKKWRRKDIDEEQARDGLDGVARMISRWHETDHLLPEALGWSMRFDHPVYDFCYLALAQRLGARMVTADERLFRAVAGTHLSTELTLLRDLG